MERSTRRSANSNKDTSDNKGTTSRRRRREDHLNAEADSNTTKEVTDDDEEYNVNVKQNQTASDEKHRRNQEDEGVEDEEEEEEEPSTVDETVSIRRSSRRERSQSIVSTTSDGSSVVSESLEEGRENLHEEKLQELLKKKKMIEDGTLAEYCRRITEFKEERNRLLQTAEWHKSLQLKNTSDLYGFEVQRAHHIWEDAKQKVQNDMLAANQALRVKVQRELESIEKNGTLPSVHKPLKRSNPSESNPAASKYIKKMDIPVPTNVLYLPFDNITSDVNEIARGLRQTANRLQPGLEKPRLSLSVERRRLICGTYVFEEGDEVVMTSTVLKKDFVGVITSVDDQELYVKLSTTGQKVCVSIEHIATRRCEVRPFLRGTVGIESFQSSGWVECEPF